MNLDFLLKVFGRGSYLLLYKRVGLEWFVEFTNYLEFFCILVV